MPLEFVVPEAVKLPLTTVTDWPESGEPPSVTVALIEPTGSASDTVAVEPEVTAIAPWLAVAVPSVAVAVKPVAAGTLAKV